MDVVGLNEILEAFHKVEEDARHAAEQIVKRSQVVLVASIQKQFTGAHPRKTPTTSAPGSPPDVVTGSLRRSIRMSPVTVSGVTATGSVYPSMVYARIQELGGNTGRGGHTHLPARPYVQPGYNEALPALQIIAREEWAKMLH